MLPQTSIAILDDILLSSVTHYQRNMNMPSKQGEILCKDLRQDRNIEPGTLQGQGAWEYAGSSAIVQTSEVYAGEQALKLRNAVATCELNDSENAGIVIEDCRAKFNYYTGGSPAPNGPTPFYADSNGRIRYYSSMGWQTAPEGIVVSEDEWSYVVITRDMANNRWSLWINGKTAVSNVAVHGTGGAVYQQTSLWTPGTTIFDELRIGQDLNNNAIPDWYERKHNLDAENPDKEYDGVSDADEYRYGTDPDNWDTDGDGYSDHWEIEHGSNPSDPEDSPEPEEGDRFIQVSVCDNNGNDDSWGLRKDGIMVLVSKNKGIANRLYAMVPVEEEETTVKFELVRIPYQQMPLHDEYNCIFEGINCSLKMLTGSAKLIDSLDYDGDRPPSTAGIYWEFEVGEPIIKAEFDHAKVNTRNLTHADDDFPDYEHCVAEIWDSSREVNLEDFLTAESLTFKDYLDWYVDGTKQSSSILNYGSEPGNNEIKDYEVHVTVKDSSAICDRLILVIVPTSTEQAHNDWVTTWSANTAWLAELPAAYGSITFDTSGDPEDPEPGTCTNEYWEDSVATLDSYFHPGATYEMRSEETPGGHGHQACYTGPGGIITSGVAAGTADSHHKSDIITPSHRTEDVLPFVRAAQLDGNPVWVNDLFPFDLNRPMMYEGSHLQQYLQLRPPIPNSKPLLTPGTCAP